jgi:hypothetical protein
VNGHIFTRIDQWPKCNFPIKPDFLLIERFRKFYGLLIIYKFNETLPHFPKTIIPSFQYAIIPIVLARHRSRLGEAGGSEANQPDYYF